MSEITTRAPRPVRPGRRAGLAVAALATLAVAGGGVALADGRAVFRQDNGQPAVNGDALLPAYRGRIVTQGELEALQARGLATFGEVNRELACQGITLYFDTDSELTAYQRAYEPRHRAAVIAEQSQSRDADPCAVYAGSPRFVSR